MPTYDELVLFYYNRHVEAGKGNTLPSYTNELAKEVIGNYQTLITTMQMKDIINIFNESRSIEKRKQIENGNSI